MLRKHLTQLPEPQLTSFSAEEQQLSFELHQGEGAPEYLSLSPASLQRTSILASCIQDIVPNLITISEDWKTNQWKSFIFWLNSFYLNRKEEHLQV